jgi:hypothetical protein
MSLKSGPMAHFYEKYRLNTIASPLANGKNLSANSYRTFQPSVNISGK